MLKDILLEVEECSGKVQTLHQNIDREFRYCQYYVDVTKTRVTEDELYFLFMCPKYKFLREKYFRQILQMTANVFNFNKIMQNTDHKILVNLSMYAYEGFKLRSTETL